MPAAAAESAALSALLLPVGADLYALPLAAIDQVRRPEPPTPLPDAPAAVLGVINVRGQVVGILDTGVLLGLDPVGGEAAAAIVVVRLARGPAGLAVSGMPRSELLTDDLGASTLPTAHGRRRAGKDVVTLLDLEATLSPERIAA